MGGGSVQVNSVDYIEVDVDAESEPIEKEAITESTDSGVSAPEQIEETNPEEVVEAQP